MLYPNPLQIPMDEFNKIEAPWEIPVVEINSETRIHVLGNPSDNVPFLEYFREIERLFCYYPWCVSVDPYTSARI